MPLASYRKLYISDQVGAGPGGKKPVKGHARKRGKLRAPVMHKERIRMCCRCMYNTDQCRALLKSQPGKRCPYCAVQLTPELKRKYPYATKGFCMLHQRAERRGGVVPANTR